MLDYQKKIFIIMRYILDSLKAHLKTISFKAIFLTKLMEKNTYKNAAGVNIVSRDSSYLKNGFR